MPKSSLRVKQKNSNFVAYIASFNRFFCLRESKHHDTIVMFYSTPSIEYRNKKNKNRIADVAYTSVSVKHYESI